MINIILFCLLQDDWTAAKNEASKALKSPDPAVRLEGVSKIASFDKKDAVDLNLDFWAVSSRLIRQYRIEKADKIAKADAMPIKKKLQGGQITLNGDEVQQKEEYDKLQSEAAALDKKISEEDRILSKIRETLSKMTEAESLTLLRKTVSDGKDWTVRGAAAEALGAIRDTASAADLRKALKKEKDPRAQVSMIEALGKIGDKDAIADLGEQLRKGADWQIKSAAAQALKSIGDPRGIEPLIEGLKDAAGRLKDEINQILVGLTGEDKHGDYKTWKDWYATNKESLLSGRYERPKSQDSGKKGGTTFYGLDVVSKRVIFILDRSGSMSEPTEWKPDTDVASGSPGGGKPEKIGDRKIDVARYELKKAIQSLPEDTKFNVIFYSHDYQIWVEDALELATPANKKKAIEFVEKLEPEGQTNIFDPTEKAFLLQDLKDPKAKKDNELGAFKGGVDTIYLMSDGLPNRGRITDGNGICEKIKEMNRDRKIVIHTIAVGKGSDPKFMERLATENGGKFVHRK